MDNRMDRHLSELPEPRAFVARSLPARGDTSSASTRTAWVVVVFALRVVAALALFHFCVSSSGNMPSDQGLSNAALGR